MPAILVGSKFISKSYGEYEVIEYNGALDVKVRFTKTGYITSAQSGNVRTGSVKDKYFPAVHGIGYIGEGVYGSRSHEKAYIVWNNMLKRCYNEECQKLHPTYKGCKVCVEWHNFQVFAAWFYENYIDGFELDKDIKGDGKLYSPETCSFVSQQTNIEEACAKSVKLLSPTGEIIEVYNLRKFAHENGLNQGNLNEVTLGNRKSHKGWRLAEQKA